MVDRRSVRGGCVTEGRHVLVWCARGAPLGGKGHASVHADPRAHTLRSTSEGRMRFTVDMDGEQRCRGTMCDVVMVLPAAGVTLGRGK